MFKRTATKLTLEYTAQNAVNLSYTHTHTYAKSSNMDEIPSVNVKLSPIQFTICGNK